VDAIPVSTRIARGTPEFSRTNLALFAAGWATFALIYAVQPMMPLFAESFAVTPAASSLAISATTGVLAVMLLVAGSLSECVGRKGIMSLSLLLSAILTVAVAFAPNFASLVVMRAVMGITIAGIPSVAMAYLSEEIEPTSLGYAMGLYIGGSAFGGMSGRFLTAMIADFTSWRVGVGLIGVMGLVCSVIFWRSLPPSRHFVARPMRLSGLAGSFANHLTDKGLPWLFALGFLLMGSFVTLYNYIGFRLVEPPYNLSQTLVGVLFCVYILGMVASTWGGKLADRFGRRQVLWIAVVMMLAGIVMTFGRSLGLIVGGVAVITVGFFAAHSVASSWVGRRALVAKAQAASLYLFFYYLGSSIVGSLSGYVWVYAGWSGVALELVVMQLLALLIAMRLAFLKPLPIPQAPSLPSS
jgi:YNFM family putative membrane transporter